MKFKAILLIVVMLTFYSCKNDIDSFKRTTQIISQYYFFYTNIFIDSRTRISLLIKTQRGSYMADAACLIRKYNDTTFIPFLLCNADNANWSNGYISKGMSVYECKMKALKKISGLQPPKSITDEPDSVIIKFYTNWALKKGYKL